MKIILNSEQSKSLSSFFNNIAVAWFVAAFVTPNVLAQFYPLNLLLYFANMIGALLLSLLFLKG